MEFHRPICLLLLLFLPLIWWLSQRSLAPLQGARRLTACVMRMLVFSFIVLALAEPRWRGATRQQQVILMVDQSLSVGDGALKAAERFVGTADFGEASTAWVSFAGQTRIWPDLEALKAGDENLLVRDETRLDRALALASASFDAGVVKTLVLFSDGVSTGNQPESKTLSDLGIRLHTVPITAEEKPEVLVREVLAPASVREGEPLAIEAVIQSSISGSATIDLFRNGVRIASRPQELRKGANTVRFDDRTEKEKLLYYEVGVRSAEDTIAENNQTGVAVVSEGVSRVMLLTDRPDSARYLEWALRQEGIELSVRPMQAAPTQMSDLQNFDVVIMDNIPASALSRAQMNILHSYVSDFGGGLLMLGGDQAYGLGGYFRTPIEDVLPVSCDFQKEEEAPTLALTLVIDRSGSMSGENIELAKAAAKASVDLLSRRDYVSVIAFDNEVYPVVPLQSAQNASSISGEIAAITADGGTNMAPAMEEALRQLLTNSAKLKHVILLTDGMSQEGPFAELSAEMARNGITISTVGMGAGADSNLLSQIAEWGGGRYYEAVDPSTVPQIFTKETMTASKSAIQEFPFLAKPVRAVDFLEGVNWASAPFLLGYVRTKLKPTAETWLMTERGDPLLTTWRYGLGTTAAFTSDARNRWAVEWLRWPGFGKFWGQLLRRLSRPTSLGLSEVQLQETAGKAMLTVDVLGTDQGFPVQAEVSARIAGPSGVAESIVLNKQLPGRWQAEFPVSERGVYSGQIQVKEGDSLLDTRFFTLSRGFSREYLMEPTDKNELEALATQTGGVISPDPLTVFKDDQRSAVREHPLWPWLALAALLLFVVDVAVRRWPDSLSPKLT